MLEGIEKAFITKWNVWDEHDVGVLGFEGIELVPEVADVLTENGADRYAIDYVVVDTQRNTVEFFDGSKDESYCFRLNVSLGARVLID